MGNLSALAFAEKVAEGVVSLEDALVWHLQANHFPPIPLSLVPVCLKAIEKARAGKWAAEVRLPKGVSYRGGQYAPVSAVVEQHHLDAFIGENGD